MEDSLRTLDQAIRLNPALRFQARNDSDFQNLAEDPASPNCCIPILELTCLPSDGTEEVN